MKTYKGFLIPEKKSEINISEGNGSIAPNVMVFHESGNVRLGLPIFVEDLSKPGFSMKSLINEIKSTIDRFINSRQ